MRMTQSARANVRFLGDVDQKGSVEDVSKDAEPVHPSPSVSDPYSNFAAVNTQIVPAKRQRYATELTKSHSPTIFERRNEKSNLQTEDLEISSNVPNEKMGQSPPERLRTHKESGSNVAFMNKLRKMRIVRNTTPKEQRSIPEGVEAVYGAPSQHPLAYPQQSGYPNVAFLQGDIRSSKEQQDSDSEKSHSKASTWLPVNQVSSRDLNSSGNDAKGMYGPPKTSLAFSIDYPMLDNTRVLSGKTLDVTNRDKEATISEAKSPPTVGNCVEACDNGSNPAHDVPQVPILPEFRPSFMYSSLTEHPSGTIRLIRFDSMESGELCYTIVSFDPWKQNAKHHPQLKDIEYYCLSYCWGYGGKARQISIRTGLDPEQRYEVLPITENLYDALKSLVGTHGHNWLWIDAISINQNDVHERSSQVSMMKDIYNKAEGVVIWLGDSEAAINAFPVMSYISKRFTADTGIHVPNIISSNGLMLSPEHLELLKQYTMVDVADKTPMEAYADLADFFLLPWFRRVWVLQEALSQTIITARMGKLSVHWGSIILAALWQSFLTRDYTANPPPPTKSSSHQKAGYLPELWLGLIHNRIPRGLSVVELVCRARDFHASDPRDKVFGLLGLANDISLDTDLRNLRPDYTRSKTEVYSGFAQDIIRKTGTLDILSAVNTFTDESGPDNSISWMPDLDISIATIRGLGFPSKYNASFSTKALISTPNHPAILSLSGFILDVVSPTISPLLTLRTDLQLYIGASPNAIPTLWTDYLQPHYDPNAEASLQAFIHTLTAAGFALRTQFPAHPLGKIVPPHSIPSLAADLAAYIHKTQSLPNSPFPNTEALQKLAADGDADQFAVLVGKACHERKFFITGEGRMGLCPRGVKEGDRVVVLYGGSVPYALRKVEGDRWCFVGECYVDGWMFGEAEGVRGQGVKEERVFDLV